MFREGQELEASTWRREKVQIPGRRTGPGSRYDLGVTVVCSLSLGVKSEHPCGDGAMEKSQILKKGSNEVTLVAPADP